MAPSLHILCLSNLAWERGLFQRPQQLMTRFAARGHRVQYLARVSSQRWYGLAPGQRRIAFAPGCEARNLPFLPLSGRVKTVNGLSLRLVGRAAKEFVAAVPAGRRVLWLQHPDYLPLAARLPVDLLVYDAMDPFESFARTAPWVPARERELLARVDLLFTGGRSLHRQREGLARAAHCFPSGIDFPHFAHAAQPGPVPEDLARLGRPVLGYVGAVDERIDWPLVRALCTARPQWHVVFIGPVLATARPPDDVPNLHLLGARDYDRLPDYLRGCDVALIPWHVNELTRLMSPTKTPEYLASGRPVVSTPIPDVVDDYGSEVLIADGAEAFLAACERALAQGTGPARKPPQARTWDEIAGEMIVLMEKALAETLEFIEKVLTPDSPRTGASTR